MINTLIIEDNPEFRDAIKQLLTRNFPMIRVDVAKDGLEGFSKLADSSPDVIFMDIELPGENGLELTRRICGSYDGIDIVVISNHDFPEYRQQAYRNGAGCFIAKSGNYCLADILAWIEGAMVRKRATMNKQKMN